MTTCRLRVLIIVLLLSLNASVAFANFAPRTIYAPVGNPTLTGTDIQFTWDGAATGANWWLQVGDNLNFGPASSLVINTLLTVYYYYDSRCINRIAGFEYCPQISTVYSIPANNTAHSKQFYWRVTGSNDNLVYDVNWSQVGAFLQAPSLPATPGIVSPVNEAYIKGPTVTFTWNAASNVTNYYLEVYNKNNSLIFGNWVGNVSSYTPPIAFADDGGRCYWRVKTKNDGGESSFSAYGYFVNGKAPIAAAPSLSAPGNRTFLAADGGNIAFQWSQVTNAESYDLQLSATSDFSSVSTMPSTTNSISIAKSSLAAVKKYYWRVRAVNYHGGGDFSETRQFIVGANAECWPETGSGVGFTGPQSHIDTCFDTGTSSYQLKDVSRRLNMNVDQHNGRMPDSAAITTRLYTATTPLTDADNAWNDAEQKSAVDAQVNTAKVYDYFLTALKLQDSDPFGLNSYDKLGSTMLTEVEVTQHTNGKPCINNAYWFGAKMNICKGTDTTPPFSASLDVIAHEWGHALTENASGLVYLNESGALDEAFADWIGVAVEAARGKGLNWTIGEDTITLRDLQTPKLYQQPDYYKDPDPNGYWFDYTAFSTDFGGVHTNSGVPNKMFSLLASGGTHPNPRSQITVKPITLERAVRIAYRANATKAWSTDSDFAAALTGMVRAATSLFTENSNEVYQVKNAWAAVGVGELAKITTSTNPPDAGVTFAYLQGSKLLSCPVPPETTACISERKYKSACCTYERYDAPFGEKVTVEATANPGYYFKDWTVNGYSVSSSPSYSFTATADSSPVANFTTTPPSISAVAPLGDFLTVSTSTTSPEHTFTVINNGSQTMSIASSSLGGDNPAEFSITSDGCSGQLLPAASCNIKVRFAPTAAGAKTASLTIPSNDTISPSYVIALSGLAGSPVMTSSPSGLNVLNYSSIQTAYNSIANGNEIKLWATDFSENLTFNRPVTTTIRGGYNGNFADRPGKTAIQGSLTISSGTVIIDGLKLGGSSYQSTLKVVIDTPSSGTVTSFPSGINCTTSCSSSRLNGDQLTLTATPVGDSVFTGWLGGGCSGTGSCTVAISEDVTVTASFSAAKIVVAPVSESFGTAYIGTSTSPQTITVTSSGTHDLLVGTPSFSGANTSDFTMIDTCSGHPLAQGATCTVQVAFTPSSTGARTASLLIPSNDPQTPVFSVSLNGIGKYPALTVSKAGAGTGTVTSSPGGISCGSSCSSTFTLNAPVTLTATPDFGYTFTAWSGACSGAGNCTLTMDADLTATATFIETPIASCSANPAMLNGTLYSSIQAAYNAATDNSNIKLLATDIYESFIANRGITVTIDGGYKCSFATSNGTTVIHGAPDIAAGAVILINTSINQ